MHTHTLFKGIGILLAAYTVWAAFVGKVHTKSAGLRPMRTVVREEEPVNFWATIVVYGGLSIALMTVF